VEQSPSFEQFRTPFLKGIGSILFLKKCLEKHFRKKNYKKHLISNNYEGCTSVAHCFPIILDVTVLENTYYLQILKMKW
jgi:hypothetical protein